MTTKRALEGIRVLDLSRILAGPYAAQILGDLGADVIKIEHPARGDDTRQWGPPFWGDAAVYYLTANRNKRSRAIDFTTDAGRAELHAWLGELVADPQHEYPQFVTALSLLGALHPDDAVALLQRRLTRLREIQAETQSLNEATLAAGVHPLFQVEEDYRLALLDAEIGFVERLIDRIDNPADGWAPVWAAFHSTHGTPDEGNPA